uniref:ARID domain-containing protein n=1 Tax=Ciona savignyi TaxID=51511 RepID=H2YXB9_CIOSA
MSNISNDGEKLAFLNGLKQYLEDRGKILIPYPRLAGKVLDLHDLYNRVTSL